MTCLPVSPGAEFLLRFGKLKEAESLIDADLSFIKALMADLTIPNISWFEQSYTALDSLIARSFWIGALVRERASGQLAHLLLNPKTEDATLTALLTGLSSEMLESRVLIWLLPMVNASRSGWNAPIEQIKKAIQAPSIVSEHLLSELQ